MVGQAGKPKTITGFQTHTTPVLLAFGERAELATEECNLLMNNYVNEKLIHIIFIYVFIVLMIRMEFKNDFKKNFFRRGCNTNFGRLCDPEKESGVRS